MTRERHLTNWAITMIAGFSVVSSFIVGCAVWFLKPSTVEVERDTPPVTVTRTVPVTVTESASAPTAPPRAPSAPPPHPDSPQWVVRTPAGMACLIVDTAVTCTGGFNARVEGYTWQPGQSRATPVTSPVQLPGTGEQLEYGTRRSAGPWTIAMRKDGITFLFGKTRETVTFNRSGAEVGIE